MVTKWSPSGQNHKIMISVWGQSILVNGILYLRLFSHLDITSSKYRNGKFNFVSCSTSGTTYNWPNLEPMQVAPRPNFKPNLQPIQVVPLKSILNYSSCKIYSCYGLNTLGPLCLWQWFMVNFHFSPLVTPPKSHLSDSDGMNFGMVAIIFPQISFWYRNKNESNNSWGVFGRGLGWW